MKRRSRSLFIMLASWAVFLALRVSATFGQQEQWPNPREKVAIASREAILMTTNRALTALVEANKDRKDGGLRISEVSDYVAIVEPDFLLIDSRGQVIDQPKVNKRNWANVVPLKTRSPVPGE